MKAYLLALVVGIVAVLLWLDRQEARRKQGEAEQREAKWQARYAEQVIESERVADTVIREVTKTRTLRDSVLMLKHDTAIVERFIYQTDTLMVSCERCAQQLRAFRVTSDSLLRAKDIRIEALKPSKWDKVRPWVMLGAGFYIGAKLRVP